jgi:hypothetical protein
LRWLTNDWAGSGGHGMLTVPPSRALNAYDNLPAIHVVGPFGRFVALGTLFGFLALLGFSCAHAARSTQSLKALIAAFALATLVTVSAYMVAANLEFAPFTGKNVYLISAVSWSDLVEGMTLVIIILLCMPMHSRSREYPTPSADHAD